MTGVVAVGLSLAVEAQWRVTFGTYAPALDNLERARLSAAAAYLFVTRADAGDWTSEPSDAAALVDRARLAVEDALAGRSRIIGLAGRPLADQDLVGRLRGYAAALDRFKAVVVTPTGSAAEPGRADVGRRVAYARADAVGQEVERRLLRGFSSAIARQHSWRTLGMAGWLALVLIVTGVVLVRGRRRRAAAAMLVDSEAHYRKLFEEMAQGVVYQDRNGAVTAANPAAERILGASLAQLRARPPVDFGWHAIREDGSIFPANEHPARQVLATGRPVSGVVMGVLNPREQAVRWIQVAAVPEFRDGETAPFRVFSTFEDITGRKRAVEALRESEERFRSLVETLTDWVWEVDAGDRYVYASPRVAQVLGYTPEEILGRTPFDLMVPEEAARMREAFQVYKAGRRPFALLENVNVRRDGRTVIMETSGTPVIGPDGGLRGYRGTDRDITQRRQAETERRRLATAVDQATEAFLITDTQGVIEYVNPAFERITGYRGDEVIGLTPRIVKSGRQDVAFYEHLWRTILAGEVWTGTLINCRKDGTEYHEAMTITPLRDERGDVVRFVAVKADITARVDLERQLAQAQKMEAVGRLAGGVAHDFNNILQAMLTTTQLLGMPRDDDPSAPREEARELESLVERASQLTRQLLLFSRRERTRPEPGDLNDVVRTVERLLRRLLRANISVGVELAGEPLPVRADHGQLEQVMVNLAINASDAMPEGGALTITSGADGGDGVWFALSDTGGGIPAALREKIFEPFFTTKEPGRGTGLGLAVVHGIVAAHGGRIAVESADGGGTTFRVWLPRMADAEAPTSSRTRGEVLRGRGERVLLVEDEPSVRTAVTQLLTRLGYVTVAAASGEEAVALEDRTPFDLLLTDTMLPGITGVDVVRALRERWPAMGIILMSGYAADEVLPQGENLEKWNFLQKPIDLDVLARTIRRTLDRR